jgi:2'-5' RNA ligase
MARRRIVLAALFDVDTAAALDDLRRSLGVDDVERLPPHITLVPPSDRPAQDVEEAWPQLMGLAAGTDPLHLVLGPGASFQPRTPTIHLAVGGTEDQLDRLTQLRERLLTWPLARTPRWPFVPHVTLCEDAPAELIAATLPTLAHIGFEVDITAVHLLEHLPRPQGGRRWWRPVAEAPLTAG